MVDLEPALPRIVGDRTHLQEALLIVLTAAVRAAADGTQLRLEGVRTGDTVRLTVSPAATALPPLEQAVAGRVLGAMGARLTSHGGATVIELPRAAPG
jgi:hypothetical protein